MCCIVHPSLSHTFPWCQRWSIMKGMVYPFFYQVHHVLHSFLKQNICPVQAFCSFAHLVDQRCVSCKNMSKHKDLKCAKTLLHFTGLWIPSLFQLKKRTLCTSRVSDIFPRQIENENKEKQNPVHCPQTKTEEPWKPMLIYQFLRDRIPHS